MSVEKRMIDDGGKSCNVLMVNGYKYVCCIYKVA